MNLWEPYFQTIEFILVNQGRPPWDDKFRASLLERAKGIDFNDTKQVKPLLDSLEELIEDYEFGFRMRKLH